MRNIITTIVICSILILASGCTNNQATIQPTALPSEVIGASPSSPVETAYPSAIGNETPSTSNNIQTAYPSTDGDISTAFPEGSLPVAPLEALEPNPGMASISGVLYSFTIKQVIQGTGFFLIPAVGPEKRDVPPIIVAPEASRGEIISRSADNGDISMKDVPPGNYYLVVWAPLNWSVAQISAEDSTPLLLELKAGSRIPLGVIYISWP